MKSLFQEEKEMSLFDQVRDWHYTKGLIFEENLTTQALKLIEEISELLHLDEYSVKSSKYFRNQAIDAVGDSLVCISSCCDILRLILKRPEICLEKIKAPENKNSYVPKDIRELAFSLLKDLSSGVLKHKYEFVLETLGSILIFLHDITCDWKLPNSYECLKASYDEIKDRTGKVVNGNFIKQADL